MADIFDKFNQNIDTKELEKDVLEAEKNGGGGNYPEIPDGTYEVEVTGLTTKNNGTYAPMEVTASKKGSPMVRIIFKIRGGEHDGALIFYNQVIEQGFQINNVNNLLRSMELETVNEYMDKYAGKLFLGDYRTYNDLLQDCAEEIESSGLTFGLHLGTNSKGYKTYSIEDVFEK